MDSYTELRSFVEVALKGSFAAAAVTQGVTPAILGRRLNALEKRLGVKLMHRSTRGLNLTETGEQLLEQARPLLRQFAELEAGIASSTTSLSGQLSVTAPAGFGRRHIAPHVAGFRQLFPELKLSFNFTDRLIDLVEEGYDLGIRIGGEIDPNYVAIRLAGNRRLVCGTPEYFARHGKPEQPEDLVNHNCLTFYPHSGHQRSWTFQRQGQPLAVKVSGDLSCNDGELLLNWICQSLGIGWRSTWEIQPLLGIGQLQTVLDDYAQSDYDIYAVYPQHRYLPTKVRRFIDYLKQLYEAPDYWHGKGQA